MEIKRNKLFSFTELFGNWTNLHNGKVIMLTQVKLGDLTPDKPSMS